MRTCPARGQATDKTCAKKRKACVSVTWCRRVQRVDGCMQGTLERPISRQKKRESSTLLTSTISSRCGNPTFGHSVYSSMRRSGLVCSELLRTATQRSFFLGVRMRYGVGRSTSVLIQLCSLHVRTTLTDRLCVAHTPSFRCGRRVWMTRWFQDSRHTRGIRWARWQAQGQMGTRASGLRAVSGMGTCKHTIPS